MMNNTTMTTKMKKHSMIKNNARNIKKTLVKNYIKLVFRIGTKEKNTSITEEDTGMCSLGN